MELNLKENLNINSIALQHNILLRAIMLLEGREGALETEKRLYLMIALVDTIIKEDLLELCNEDERDLPDIIMEEIEPFFYKLIEENEDIEMVYEYLTSVLLDHCQQIWDNQHSMMGVVDAILTTIATMSEEDKKEALVATGKIAEQAFERRTEQLAEKTEAVNSKLEALVKQYQQTSAEVKENGAE